MLSRRCFNSSVSGSDDSKEQEEGTSVTEDGDVVDICIVVVVVVVDKVGIVVVEDGTVEVD